MCHPEVPDGTPVPQARTENVQIEVGDGAAMPALLALPDQGPAPGVLLIGDMYGQAPFYDHLTRRLAAAGFVALHADYFFRQEPLTTFSFDAAMARRSTLDGAQSVRDFRTCLDWLAARPECTGALGTLGFCAGGTFVLNLAAERHDLATVAYYAFPDGGRARSASEPPTPLEAAHQMTGPILAFWGDQDAPVGMHNVQALQSTLQAVGIKHEFHVYPDLGHGFLKQLLDDEHAPGHRQASQSWERTLEFYRTRLA